MKLNKNGFVLWGFSAKIVWTVFFTLLILIILGVLIIPRLNESVIALSFWG